MAELKTLKLKTLKIWQTSNIGGELKVSTESGNLIDLVSGKIKSASQMQKLLESDQFILQQWKEYLVLVFTVKASVLSMLDVRICRGYPSPGSALSSSSLLAGRGDFLGPSGCHHKYSSSKFNASSAIQVNLKIDWTPNGLCIEVNKTSKRNYGLTYLKCDRSFSTFAKYVLLFFFPLLCFFILFLG